MQSQSDCSLCFPSQELNNTCEPVVTQPKPKIESPKVERTPNGPSTDKKEEDLEGKNNFNAEPPHQNGECYPNEKNSINMDLDQMTLNWFSPSINKIFLPQYVILHNILRLFIFSFLRMSRNFVYYMEKEKAQVCSLYDPKKENCLGNFQIPVEL